MSRCAGPAPQSRRVRQRRHPTLAHVRLDCAQGTGPGAGTFRGESRRCPLWRAAHRVRHQAPWHRSEDVLRLLADLLQECFQRLVEDRVAKREGSAGGASRPRPSTAARPFAASSASKPPARAIGTAWLLASHLPSSVVTSSRNASEISMRPSLCRGAVRTMVVFPRRSGRGSRTPPRNRPRRNVLERHPVTEALAQPMHRDCRTLYANDAGGRPCPLRAVPQTPPGEDSP